MAYRNYWDAVLRLKDEDENETLFDYVMKDLIAKMNSQPQDIPPVPINLEEMI